MEAVLAAHQALLREQLSLFLQMLPTALTADVRSVLTTAGKLLSVPEAEQSALPSGTWPLLTLLVAEHVRPSVRPAYAATVAIAVECLLCALDLLDDVEDDDRSEAIETLGVARVLNVSTALLALAHRAISATEQYGLSADSILRLHVALDDGLLRAADGQHRDLLAEGRASGDMTQTECIEIAEAKSGSLMGLACCLGALCAGADEPLAERYTVFGILLGIAHQLDNDAHDLSSSLAPHAAQQPVKSDLRRHKMTLPIALSGQALKKSVVPADGDNQRNTLQAGITAAWALCLLYRKRASLSLHQLEEELGPAPRIHYLTGME